ncbi:MAG: sigma-70 family RNA polymerase sigma factor [Chloroflexota bacterium]|nr:sigma-70 family RNA polymerase sigma factor [Chloroflexota bacterium]
MGVRWDGPARRTALASASQAPLSDDASYDQQSERLSALAPDDTRANGTDGARACTFDQFYLRHEQPLYGYLRRLLPSHEIAVEIAQETFFRAWRHFGALSGYERPEAWLYRVATNLAISHLRRRRPLSLSSLLASPNATDDELSGADSIASPLDVEGQAAERDTIGGVLGALPARQRAALLLAAAQGQTTDEIAAALDVSPANARKILSRARERFRRLYDEAQRLTT